jgi:hypothetical protein
MTSSIFQKWMIQLNNEMEKVSKKILFILDNAPSHPSTSLSCIELLYLHKNTTSITQHLDMGIIKAFKKILFKCSD